MRVNVSRNPLSNKKEMFEQIRKDIDNKKKVYLIVPEQSTLSTELDLFEYFNIQSILDLKVKSFRSIINEILLSKGGLKLNFISEFSQKLLLKIAIDKVKEQIRVYNKSLNKEGFIDIVLNFIKVIKSNLINHEQLKIINDNASYNKELKEKISDIQIIYSAYSKLLSNSSYDSHDRINLAIEKIKDMDLFEDICFYIDQFSNMSKQEIEFISQIEKKSNNVTINITIDSKLLSSIDSNIPAESIIDDAEVFEVSKRFIKALSTNYLEFNIVDKDAHKSPQVDFLLRNIFSYKIPSPKRKEDKQSYLLDIFVKRYKNTTEECEMLAIDINKDIYKNKLRFKDIAVVVTDKQEYYDKIKRQFKLNNISFFMDSHRDLLENPIAKYIKSAIALLGSNFGHEYIVSYMKNAFFILDTEETFNQYELNIFQNFLAQRRIVGNMIFEDRYFDFDNKKLKRDYKYKEEDQKNFEIANKIRNIFLSSISSFGSSISKILKNNNEEDTFKNYCKKIYEFISLDQAMKRVKEFEEKLDTEIKNEIIEENRLIWNKFISILDDFSKVDDDIKISFNDFSRYLEEAMSDIKIGIVPPSKDQIQVGDLDRSRFNQVKKLYVLGMTNIFFPKSHSDADLLIDSEKESLIDNGIEIENTNSKYSDKDIFALYNVISKANLQIVFTYSLVDSQNTAMQKARLINYIKPLIKRENYILDRSNYKDYIFSKTKLSYYLPMTQRRIKNNKKIDEEEKKFAKELIKKISHNEQYKSIASSLGYEKEDKKYPVQEKTLNNLAVEKAFSDEKNLSISQIEAYKSCPYKHFISYGLKPREDNSFNIDPLSFGNIVHNSVDVFIDKYAKTKFDNQSDVEKAMKDDLDKSVSDNISSYQMEDYKNKYYINNLTSMLNVSLFALNKQYDLMKPDRTYTESLYGDGPYAQFTGLNYIVNDKLYKMKGIIDRVDEYDIGDRKYFRVIDYKTGNKQFDLLKVYHGLDLQLMVYLYTVSKLRDASPLGACYMRLNHKFKHIGYDEKLDQMIMDKHRLDGLLIDDRMVLERSDKSFNFDQRPNSLLVQVDNRFKDYKKQKNFISEKSFESLFDHTNRIISESIKEIKEGNIEVKPYKLKNQIPCTFCPYKTICRFRQDNYRILEDIDKKDLLKKLGDNNG